jgi:hypothetical protein
MSEFQGRLKKLLGHEPSELEQKAFHCFDPDPGDKKKRFSRYNSGQPLYINIDDEHYLYISNYRDPLHCRLDMAAHHLYDPLCYRHENGMLMLGITRPEQEAHVRAHVMNYYIYYQRAETEHRNESMKKLPRDAAYIVLVAGESPWERLCRVCMENQAGAHITASARRLFGTEEHGLLYFVPEHLHSDFKRAAEKQDLSPGIIGKTLSYPVIGLENENGVLEIPLSTLRILQQQQHRQHHKRKVFSEDNSETKKTAFIDNEEIDIAAVLETIDNEYQQYPTREYAPNKQIPGLRIDAFPMRGMHFNEKSVELHTLSAIVNLHIQSRKVLALSYFIESTANTPFELDPLIAVLNKSAELFDVPVANSRVEPGKRDRLLIFLVSRESGYHIPKTFQEAGDFICLLGDPNGVLEGSAYAKTKDSDSLYAPPGVMSGTLAALADVVEACAEKSLLRSVSMIGRGGLITALYHAGADGLGANIYSERKSPEPVFIFGEPQAALMISLREKHLIDLARITSLFNVTSTTIGRVSDNPEIVINKEMKFPLKISGK